MDTSALTRLGITHVITVLQFMPWFLYRDDYAKRLVKLHIALRDRPFTKISNYFQESTAFIQRALEDPNAAVFVHCFQGISRSATIVAAYLLATQAQFTSAEEVVQFVQAKCDVAMPNYGFMLQLNTYAASESRLALCHEKTRQAEQNEGMDGRALEATKSEQAVIGDGSVVVVESASITNEASDAA